MTPLHYAAGVGHMDTVLALVEAGADVNARQKEGVTRCTLRLRMVIRRLWVRSLGLALMMSIC